jgi:hypothetical protein
MAYRAMNRELKKRISLIQGAIKTKNHKDYENTIINNYFYGLNFNDNEVFSAIKIDEADAFTLNIKNVAIIPVRLLLDIIKGEESEEVLGLINLLKGEGVLDACAENSTAVAFAKN